MSDFSFRPKSLRVYNPTPFTKDEEYNGTPYVMPPGESEITPIGGHYTLVANALTNKVDKIKVADVSVEDIRIFFFGHDNRSGRLGFAGLRALDGVHDEAIRAEAIGTYEKWAYADACATTAAFEQRNAKAVELKAPTEAPNERVRAAYALKAKIEKYGYSAGGGKVLPYECPQCHDRFESPAAIKGHFDEIHPANATYLRKAADIGFEVPEAPKKKGGWPKGKPRKPAESAA